MAKDKTDRSPTPGSGSEDMVEAVETKKERKEKKSNKRKIEEEAEQQVPEVVVKHKKQKKHKRKRSTEEDTSTPHEEDDGPRKTTESLDPAMTLEQDGEKAGGEDVSAEEQRVLQRKLKKLRKKEEKAKLREEGKTPTKVLPDKSIPAQQALAYLTCWNDDRSGWKFQKLRQTWLLQQMFDSEKVPDENFPVLLLYIEGLRGTAKDTTVEKAEALVKSLGSGPFDKEQEKTMCRAREVIQMLS